MRLVLIAQEGLLSAIFANIFRLAGRKLYPTSAPGKNGPGKRSRHDCRRPYPGRRSGPPALTRRREKKPLPSADRIEKTTPWRGLFRCDHEGRPGCLTDTQA